MAESEVNVKMGDQHYSAWRLGVFPNGTSWMVRWWTHDPGEVRGSDNDFKEQLLTLPPGPDQEDAATAVRQAIATGNWG